jgi:hypothetical protein
MHVRRSSETLLFLLWCTPLLLVLSATRAHAQRILEIRDDDACAQCSVKFTRILTLTGSPDVALSHSTRVVRSGTHYVAGPTYAPGTLLVYDTTGKVVKSFGRHGSGPGEINGRSYRLMVGPGDTVHVVDLKRWIIFRPGDYQFVRSFAVPGLATHVGVAPNGDAIISYQAFGQGLGRAVIERLNPLTGARKDSLDTGPPSEDLLGNVRVLYADATGVWFSPLSREEISVVTYDGRSVIWRRESGWFPASNVIKQGEPFYDRPSPRVAGLRTTDRHIWLFANVADKDWKPLARSAGHEAVKVQGADPSAVFDGVVEVVERSTGRVVVRSVHDWVARPIPGTVDLVQRSVVSPDGEIHIEILRSAVVRAGR